MFFSWPSRYTPLKLTASSAPWKWMLGRSVSFCDGATWQVLFAVSFRECNSLGCINASVTIAAFEFTKASVFCLGVSKHPIYQLFFCKTIRRNDGFYIRVTPCYTPENGPGGKEKHRKTNHNLFVFHVCFPRVTSWYDKNHAPFTTFWFFYKRQALKNQRVCMKMLQSVTKHR